MPTIPNVQTTASTTKWQSPDGQKTIYEVTLQMPDGRDFKVQTFSDAIGKVGWRGDIETYEKEGKYGSQTMAKQPQREGFSQQNNSTPSAAPSGPSSGAARQTNDEAIARAVALKAAVELAATGIHDSDDVDVQKVLRTADTLLAWLQGKDEAKENKKNVDNIFGAEGQQLEMDL